MVIHKTYGAIALGIAIGLTVFGLILFFLKPSVVGGLPTLDVGNNIPQTPNVSDKAEYTDFGIDISKIGVKAPITANVNGDNKTEYNNSLKNGLAHYKGTKLPGEGSNIFIFGHSSSDVDSGPYSKIFAKLNDVVVGDTITVYYKTKKYEYTVSEKKIVAADDLSPLNLTETEQLTLMTCWPMGTKDKRLIVIAK